jgi:hypothetical protein
MYNKSRKDKKYVDGRKARWFDCDWNNDSGVQNACEQCQICKYLNFLDYAQSVGKPEGSVIEYNRKLDDYLELETLYDKQIFILRQL